MSIRLLSLWLTVCCLLLGAAPGAKPDAPSTTPATAPDFSNRIRRYKANALNIRNEIDDLTMTAKTAAFFTRDDVTLMQKDLESAAKLWEAAAAKLAGGDEDGARGIVIQVEKTDRHRHVWSDRIEMRIKALQSAPSEGMYDELIRDKPRSVYPTIARLIAARKKVSDAQLSLADAILPDGDENARSDAADRVFLADIDAHIAEMQFHWAIEDGWSHYDPAITSPDLQAINKQIADLRQQRLDDYRAGRLLDRKIQKEEEDGRKLGAQKRDVYFKILYPPSSTTQK